ncbi:MAG: hypothetical protein R2912_00385 [Eubacteriales bacterium]
MFDPEVRAIESDLIRWRRHLHQHPEVSFEETQTTLWLEQRLREIGIDAIDRPTKTGLVTHIFGNKPGKPAVVAFRADIDALPMQEDNDLPYASAIRRRNARLRARWARGDDAFSGATIARSSRAFLRRSAADLSARGGGCHPRQAIELVRAGALEGAEAVLGLHLSSAFETGMFALKEGVLTSNVDRFTVTVMGRGGHCAFPEQCADPLLAAARWSLRCRASYRGAFRQTNPRWFPSASFTRAPPITSFPTKPCSTLPCAPLAKRRAS